MASIFKAFQSEDGEPLAQIPALSCPETGKQYILWQDVEREFPGVDYLRDTFRRLRTQYMVDQDVQVLQPLRIKCEVFSSYQVIYCNHQGHQTPALKFEYLYHTWLAVFKDLEQKTRKEVFRPEFQEAAANVRYHHARLQNQLAVLREVEVEAMADGKTEDQILIEIQESWNTMVLWDYENTCLNVERGYLSCPAPCRFLVLPADLGSWDDSDGTTHSFRLYFLCDFRNNMSQAPRHKHLSNHPGYKLVRRQEFFQAYGRYALAILKMVKHGFSNQVFDFPRLDTFKILWGFDLDSPGQHLTRDTFGPLVDKAIDYIEGLSLPQRESDVVLTERESFAIKRFLVDFDGSNTLGGLYRHIDKMDTWYWVCKQHVHNQLTAGPMESLVDFVHRCGGQVDSRKATISIGLHSKSQAGQFCTLLKGNERMFHVISIKLGWRDASRQDFEGLLQKVAAVRVQHLELDVGAYATLTQYLIDYSTDIFASLMQESASIIKSLTLLNSPRPQEQYTYIHLSAASVYRVHSRQQQQAGAKHWWKDLLSKIGDFVNTIVSYNIPGLTKAKKDLQELLVKDGYEQVSSISSYMSQWHGEYDLEKGVLRELQLNDIWKWETSVAPSALESLSTLKVDVDNLNIDQEVTCVVQASPQLQRLDISVQEDHILKRIEKTFDMWQGRSNPLQLILLERQNDGRGHIVAKALVHGHSYGSLRGSASRLHGFDSQVASSQDWKRGTPTTVEFLQWNSDRVSHPLNDQAAALLDMATNQHSSIVTAFVLDISNLSHRGIAHVQNILQRSMLNCLHICCTPFDPSLTDCVRQVLLSVQWSMLQSFILSGEAVNEWIQLLVTTTGISLPDLQFQSFRIQGSGRQLVCLTHSSALFVHQLKYWNPSMEVTPENVRLQDDRDWIWF
ncbi:MAG: hypothetical protein BYD32DRAFT_413882 [Podila humilis]|nr:MAG: hypothetical protein BYD32DRAFT_413882 [Podila humilis]